MLNKDHQVPNSNVSKKFVAAMIASAVDHYVYK